MGPNGAEKETQEGESQVLRTEQERVEYHRQQGLQYAEGYHVNTRGMRLGTVKWLPGSGDPKALIFLLTGYGMDCCIYLSELGERLAKRGFGAFAVEYEGHGRSEGPRGLIRNPHTVVADCAAFFSSVRQREEFLGKPAFLYGESMGGGLALLVYRRQPDAWDGAVLLAPLCKLEGKMQLPKPMEKVMVGLARCFPKWRILPAGDILESSFQDPAKRDRAMQNPYMYVGRPRLGTGRSLLKICKDIEEHMEEITLPFLVVHGEADSILNPAASRALHARSKSRDKTIVMVPGLGHCMLEGETDDDSEKVYKEIFAWLEKHAREAVPVTVKATFTGAPMDTPLGEGLDPPRDAIRTAMSS